MLGSYLIEGFEIPITITYESDPQGLLYVTITSKECEFGNTQRKLPSLSISIERQNMPRDIFALAWEEFGKKAKYLLVEFGFISITS